MEAEALDRLTALQSLIHPSFKFRNTVAADYKIFAFRHIFHHQLEPAGGIAMHHSDGIDIYDAVAVDPEESSGIEHALDLIEGIINSEIPALKITQKDITFAYEKMADFSSRY